MIFFPTNIGKYTKYFFLSIVFSFCFSQKIEADELNLSDKANAIEQKSDFPFSKNSGYLAGGQIFDATFADEQGKSYSISDFKGNVVIILFSTTWCPNCQDSLQELDTLIENLNKEKINNVKVIALNVGNDSINAIKIHYKAFNIQNIDVYRSVSPQVIKTIRGVPACLVFDKNGNSIWGYIGGNINYKSPEFINFIKKLAR